MNDYEVIQEGKNHDEALRAALSSLDATEDQVDVEVLEKPREGLFGFLGSRNVKLRVTLKEDARPSTESEEQPQSSSPSDLRDEEEPTPIREQPQQSPPSEPAPEKQKSRPEPAEDLPPPSTGDMENPEDQVHDFLQKVINHLGVDCDIDVHEGQNEIFVDISGDDSGVIIGKFGQTLDSLQYLTNIIMGKKYNNKKKIVIDVGDYRSRREESVKKLARSVARKVIKSHKSEALSPMSPQDRRTVHLALSKFRDVQTSSEGSGINRKVIISYKR